MRTGVLGSVIQISHPANRRMKIFKPHCSDKSLKSVVVLKINAIAADRKRELKEEYTHANWGTIPELIEVVSLAQAGKIKMLVEHFPLERAGEAYHLLYDGKIQGRAVIVPNE
jgi:Zn-dependent alcohol dehydrogenases